eukprot:6526187-Pyramimonas_sp.AAC.1
MQRVDIIFIAVYLAPHLGISGSNFQILDEVGNYLKVQGKPCIIVGDWNNTIAEMQQSGLQ